MYSYDPAGQVHNVSVKFGDDHVEGSPFQLVPSEMKDQMAAAAKEKVHENINLDFHATKPHHLVASGVPDVNKLQFKTDMAYKLMSDSVDANKFHFKYEPNGVHHLDVSYDGKQVNNGQFEFVPKAMRAQREAEQKVKKMEQQYKASLDALDALKLNAANEGEEAEAAAVPDEVRAQAVNEPAVAEEPAAVEKPQAVEQPTETSVAATQRHMMQTAPQSFGPMVMSSAQQQPMMAQQQPMMQYPMMMPAQPMAYAGGNMAPPMYRMMPPAQAMQMQAQQQQQPMYRQG